MKAAIFAAPGILEYKDVPEPQIGPDEVKIRVAYCGICGTDPETVAGHFPPVQPPAIIGHEPSGTIVEVGSNIKDLKVGQRVAANFRSFCGRCYYCRNKMEHFCENVYRASGGFAEFARFHRSGVYVLPDEVSLEEGALLEPLSVALHAADRGNIYTGSSVAVIGAGTIGMLLMEIAIKAGAAKVLVSEPVPEKRALAKKLGADVVVDPLKENLEEVSKKLTDGRGFDTVFEASGKSALAKQAIFLAAKCGTVLLVSVYPSTQEIGIPPYYLYANELTVSSTRVSPYTFPRAVALLSKLPIKPLISEIVPLQEISRGFEIHGKGKSVKVLIKP